MAHNVYLFSPPKFSPGSINVCGPRNSCIKVTYLLTNTDRTTHIMRLWWEFLASFCYFLCVENNTGVPFSCEINLYYVIIYSVFFIEYHLQGTTRTSHAASRWKSLPTPDLDTRIMSITTSHNWYSFPDLEKWNGGCNSDECSIAEW